MSVSFWCPDAERTERRTPCDFPGCTPEDRCGYCQDGWAVEYKSDAPECNLNQRSAADLLRLLDLLNDPSDPYGELSVKEIPDVRRRIMRALNVESDRKALLHEPKDRQDVRVGRGEDGVPAIVRGPRIVSGGCEDHQVVRRLKALDALLAWALAHGQRVSWG